MTFASLARGLTQYRLQAVMQAPTMEELNHIWTTQGGELAYRLSVAYELALIPIEPMSVAPPARLVEQVEVETMLGAGQAQGPFAMFADGGVLTSQLSLAAGAGVAKLALTGKSDLRVAVTVAWRRADGARDTQEPQEFVLKTGDIDHADALFDLVLLNAAAGDVALLNSYVLGVGNLPAPGVAAANMIRLVVA